MSTGDRGPSPVLLVGALAVLLLVSGCTNQETPRQTSQQEAGTKTVTIPIEGMSCSACAARVKRTLTSIDGVSDVKVSLVERNARVRFSPGNISLDRIVSAINGLGYHVSTPTEVAR